MAIDPSKANRLRGSAVRVVSQVCAATIALLGAMHQGALGQTLVLDPSPVLSIGGLTEDPRYALSEVVGGLRLADGRVVVADRFTNGIRIYSSDGTYVGEVGREGQGPGEYEYIRGMARCAGSAIVAFDLHWDMKVYDSQLQLVEERSARLPGLGGGTPYEFDCGPSGHWVATGWGDTRAQFRAGYYVATAPVVLGFDDQVIADLGERLGSERIGTLRPNGNPGGSRPHPFGRQTSVAIGGDRMYVGDGGAYQIEVYDLQGRALTPIEWVGPDRTIERSHLDAFAAERLDGASPERAPSLRRWLNDLPELDDFPAYDELRVDRDGNLWVRYFPRPGGRTTDWIVFGRDGRRQGQLPLDRTTSLLDIGTDYLLVVERDELDVATVRLYRLLKG